MFLTKKTENGVLKTIREQGSSGTRENHERIKEIVEGLRQKTSCVHASWLFYGEERALQKLMRLLDGYRESPLYPGWKDFADKLEVSREVINPIDNRCFGDEGYTFYVLQHFAELENATLYKILDALLALGRYDVLTEAHELLERVADYAISCKKPHVARQPIENSAVSSRHEVDSDYGSCAGSMSTYQSLEVESETSSLPDDFSSHQIEGQADEEIIKPPNSRKVPISLKFLPENENQNENQNVVTTFIQRVPQVEHERLQTSSVYIMPQSNEICTPDPPSQKVVVQTNNNQKKRRYICQVMLTFAEDGIPYAKEVAKMFRKKRANGQNIGVLILNDHADMVELDALQFVASSFPQVHYVVPIITEGYIKAAMSITPANQVESSYLDCRFVRFIYNLMMNDYANRGCLNKKTRCIIPDSNVHLTNRTLLRQPLFGAWERLSNADALAERWVKLFSSKNQKA